MQIDSSIFEYTNNCHLCSNGLYLKYEITFVIQIQIIFEFKIVVGNQIWISCRTDFVLYHEYKFSPGMRNYLDTRTRAYICVRIYVSCLYWFYQAINTPSQVRLVSDIVHWTLSRYIESGWVDDNWVQSVWWNSQPNYWSLYPNRPEIDVVWFYQWPKSSACPMTYFVWLWVFG